MLQSPRRTRSGGGCRYALGGGAAGRRGGLAVAGKVLGANVPKGLRCGALCEEFLNAHMAPDEGGDADPALSASAKDLMGPRQGVAGEGERAVGIPRPGGTGLGSEPRPEAEDDPWLLDEELRRFVGMRNQWDGTFGHLGLLFRSVRGLAVPGLRLLRALCCERLGMGSGRSSSASPWSGSSMTSRRSGRRCAMGGFPMRKPGSSPPRERPPPSTASSTGPDG